MDDVKYRRRTWYLVPVVSRQIIVYKTNNKTKYKISNGHASTVSTIVFIHSAARGRYFSYCKAQNIYPHVQMHAIAFNALPFVINAPFFLCNKDCCLTINHTNA